MQWIYMEQTFYDIHSTATVFGVIMKDTSILKNPEVNLSVEDFGVNQKEKSDKIREDLIQSIYLLNDTELEIYLNILKYISQLTYKNLR